MKSYFYQKLISAGKALQQLFLLVIRLVWGWQFVLAGLGKWMKIASVADFFATLKIPFPLVSASLVASVEACGGLLLILRLFSRLISLPLAFTMIMALVTVHTDILAFFTDPTTLFSYSPFTFLMAALIIFIFGPGRFSLDSLFKIEPFKI